MAKIKLCKDENCHNAATTNGFCRLHYLRNWKRIKDERQQKAAERLNKYVEHIYKTHPDNYMDVIKKDLRSANFEKQYSSHFEEPDELAQLFGDTDLQAEIEDIMKELKIESDF